METYLAAQQIALHLQDWYDFVGARSRKRGIIAALRTPDLAENRAHELLLPVTQPPMQDSPPEFQAVILRVQTEDLLLLLEEVHLHITQSLLQLRNLLFQVTDLPLQLVLSGENEVLKMKQCWTTLTNFKLLVL